MMVDGVRTPGWFVECGADAATPFFKRGFGEVPLDYRPPAVGSATAAGGGAAERLHLLYKPFGTVYGPVVPPAGFIRESLREILAGVYGMRTPLSSRCGVGALATLRVDARGQVGLGGAA